MPIIIKIPQKCQNRISILIIGLLFLFSLPVSVGQTSRIEVLLIGDSSNRLYETIGLDEQQIHVVMQSSNAVNLNNLDTYDTIVLNDANITDLELNLIYNWTLEEGKGLIICMGPVLTTGNQILAKFGFTDATSFENNTQGVIDSDEFNKRKGLSKASTDKDLQSHPILSNMVWNTAPELFYMTLVPSVNGDIVHYVDMQWNDQSLEEQETNIYPILAGKQMGNNEDSNVFLFTGWLTDDFNRNDANEHFMLWPYFNYLIFTLIQTSIGETPIVYGKWDYSAVPHNWGRIILGITVLLTAILSLYLYRKARANGKKHVYFTEDTDIEVLKEHDEEPTIGEVVPTEAISEKDVNIKAELAVDAEEVVDQENLWEKIGFHRQLSGFLKLYFVMMILIIPQLLVTTIVMPQWINPYPQSSGWYSYTLHFFEAIWLFFDLGFNYAIIKYFAQYRIEQPQKAYHYVQIFVWWEIFSGVVQITIFAFIGSIILPLTNLNYLSWMFVVHSLIQFPGIFLVFQYFFQSIQRSDYQMISYALQAFVLRLTLQVISVPIFKALFKNNIVYGAAFGTSIGLLVGQLLGDWALYFITWRMYTKLKLDSRPVFYADFSKEEFIETMKFGVKMVLGEMWVPLVWFWQVWLVVRYLPNSSQEQGYFELAFTIAQVPMAMALLTSGLLGALTEAHSYKKKHLLNYTSVSGLKWGMTITTYLAASFLAIGETFVIGASGELWVKAAKLLPIFMLGRLFGPFTWQSDNEFAAAGKPIYAGIAWIIENVIKAVLMFVFILRFKTMESLLWAYVISLIVKDLYVIITLRKKIHKWDWNIWPTYIAPMLASLVIYGIFRGLDLLLVSFLDQGIISAMILLILVLYVGEYIHAFFYALFGGFDDNTLRELDLSTNMVTGVKALARFYYIMANLGAKISPLHNRFKIDVFKKAEEEAEQLTAIKRKITVQNNNTI